MSVGKHFTVLRISISDSLIVKLNRLELKVHVDHLVQRSTHTVKRGLILEMNSNEALR